MKKISKRDDLLAKLYDYEITGDELSILAETLEKRYDRVWEKWYATKDEKYQKELEIAGEDVEVLQEATILFLNYLKENKLFKKWLYSSQRQVKEISFNYY